MDMYKQFAENEHSYNYVMSTFVKEQNKQIHMTQSLQLQ